MTRWSKDVSRVVAVEQRGDVVVTLKRDGIAFRYPRKRFTVLLPYGVGMLNAEELAALAVVSERKARPRRGVSLRRGR